jgi:3'(2'), 5'-bisphosphate nucleotidase
LQKLGKHELTSMGSSLKFCRIAEGLADFYPRLGPTCEWDTAAAQAVVEAAGGQVVKVDGSALDYNNKEAYLNPHFFVFGDPDKAWLVPFRDFA